MKVKGIDFVGFVSYLGIFEVHHVLALENHFHHVHRELLRLIGQVKRVGRGTGIICVYVFLLISSEDGTYPSGNRAFIMSSISPIADTPWVTTLGIVHLTWMHRDRFRFVLLYRDRGLPLDQYQE